MLVLLGSALPVGAQVSWYDDPPALYRPIQPPTRQAMERRQSLEAYVFGILCEREDRLLEALKSFERAAQLDPQAAAVVKAQVPILLALERTTEALAATKQVLALDPEDHETWFIQGRLYRNKGEVKEALAAFQRGLALPGVKEHPDIAQQMYLDVGNLYEGLQQYAAAAEALVQGARILDHPDVLLELGPFSREAILQRAAETYERAGKLYLQAKQFDRAVAAYREAQKRYPDGASRLNFNLAQMCVEQNNLKDALTYLDAYLRFQPQGLEPYEMKVDLLNRLGQQAAVLPWLEQASRADPHNLGLKLMVARQYAIARQFPQAEKAYLELAGQAPSSEVYRGLFKLYHDDPRQGSVRSLALLNQAIDPGDKDSPEHTGRPTQAQAKGMITALREDAHVARDIIKTACRQRDPALHAETLHLLAVLADRHRQLDESEFLYRTCLKETRPQTEGLIYGGLLRVLWKANKYDDVIKTCQEGLKRAQATNHVLFYSDLARAYARLDRMDEALTEIDKAVSLAGGNDRLAVRHLRVRILVQGEQYAKAMSECEAMLQEYKQPGAVLEIRYLMSNIYSQARQLAKAEEQLEWILKMDPNNASANNDLGYIWADQGKNLKEAEALIRKAIDLDGRQRRGDAPAAGEPEPGNAAYMDSLGWVLYRRGQIEEARQELERAAALPEGQDPVIWDHLGDVYYRLNLRDRARAAWERALHYYQREHGRKMDQRYLDLQKKLKLLVTELQP
jgi:tetratricopeptide (TPR) repeat protein